MKGLRFLFFLGGLVLVAAMLRAEDVSTIDGHFYTNTTLRINGSLIMIKIPVPGSTGTVEMGLPIERIAKVSFAEPPELSKAVAAADKGNAKEVLNLTANYLETQSAYKDIPGSWWPTMARLRLLALASLGKNTESADLARQIGTLKTSGNDTLFKGGGLFSALASSDTAAVVVGAKALPRIGGDQGSALAQLALGRALLLKKDYEGALRAFLTIKVFYPSINLLQPPLLMGAGNAYVGLKDEARARQSFDEIVSNWPDSPEAPEAKKRSENLSQP